MSDLIYDRTSYCPSCGAQISQFVEIPECDRQYVFDGETFVDHFGKVRDYVCLNCSHEWMMGEPEA